MTITRRLVAVLTLSAAASAAAPAQLLRLDRPDATLDEPFSYVRGMRELSNGRLLIADWIEQRVVLADFSAGTVTNVVSEGGGPANVRLPIGLVRHLGDTTMLIDQGNNRVTFLAPDGRVVRSLVEESPGPMGVRGVDARGAFYFAIPSWAEGPNALTDDSVRVVRWMPGSGDRTRVAVVQATRWRKDRSPSQSPRIPTVGYASQDAWVISSAGEITVVRANPYRVDIVGADGRVRSGPAVPTAARAVTSADKTRFVREFSAGAAQSGRGEGGGMGRPPAASEAEIARMVTTTEFATHHPPFDASGVFAAPNGRTWVKRPLLPSEPVRYDVFDANGRREREIEFRAGRRVAYVGARGIYVVAEDVDGVQTVERYRLP
jgi:hypothetical protein